MFDCLKRWTRRVLPVLLVFLLIVCFCGVKDRYEKNQAFLGLLNQHINSCIMSIESSAPVNVEKMSKVGKKAIEIHYILEHGTLFLNPSLDYMGHIGDFEYISQLIYLYPETSNRHVQDFSSFLENLNKSLKELQEAVLEDMTSVGMNHLEHALSGFYAQWSLTKFYSDLPSPYTPIADFLD